MTGRASVRTALRTRGTFAGLEDKRPGGTQARPRSSNLPSDLRLLKPSHAQHEAIPASAPSLSVPPSPMSPWVSLTALSLENARQPGHVALPALRTARPTAHPQAPRGSRAAEPWQCDALRLSDRSLKVTRERADGKATGRTFSGNCQAGFSKGQLGRGNEGLEGMANV